MHAVSPRPKVRNRTPVEAKQRRRPPAQCDVERLASGLRDLLLGDQRVDHPIDGSADHCGVTLGHQRHLVFGDGEHVGKPPQRIGVVATHQPDPVGSGEQRHNSSRVVIVAAGDVVAERHGWWCSVQLALRP